MLQTTTKSSRSKSRRVKSSSGWRYFECPICKSHWKEAHKDYTSPGGINCINSKCTNLDEIIPYQAIQDESLVGDEVIILKSKTY